MVTLGKPSKSKGKVKNKKIVKNKKSIKNTKVEKTKKNKNAKNTKKVKKITKVKSSKKIVKKETPKKKKEIVSKKIFLDETLSENDNQVLIEEEEELKPVEFKSKSEKALEKELESDEDMFILDENEIEEDEENVDNEIKEFKKAAEEFEEYVEAEKNKKFDIFDGVSTEDPVRMYLKEIGQFNLLTLEQEKELAKRKQDAQNLLKKKKMNEQLPVSDMVKARLNDNEKRVIKDGERSQARLIECNLRLVVSIAKKYIGHGLSLLDLIQEGNLGLIRGIEKFDYNMGFKLSTYVTWWIRQAVSRALADQSKTIRIPVHMVETINKLNKIKKKLTTEMGCEPTIKQIAKAMKVSEEKVEEVMQIALDPISLDKPVGDEDDSIVADFIADKNVISPEMNAERVMLKEQIEELLSGLKEREKKVLILRFGVEDDHPRTLEEVGKELNVTRERIRQIEDKALRKLKYRAKNLQQLIK